MLYMVQAIAWWRNRLQAITGTDGDPVDWRIYASLGTKFVNIVSALVVLSQDRRAKAQNMIQQ